MEFSRKQENKPMYFQPCNASQSNKIYVGEKTSWLSDITGESVD